MAAQQGTAAADAGKKHKVTIRDVAELAHVSPATASKALSNSAHMRSTTRQRVREAAGRLGYETPRLRRSHEKKLTNTIGLITADLRGRFSIPVLFGAEKELGEQHAAVFLSDTGGEPLIAEHHIRTLLDHGVDGLILINPDTNPRPPITVSTHIPVVYAYSPSTDPDDCSVTCDNVTAGRIAVEHMLQCGKSRMVILTGPKSFKAASDRAEGALQALKEHHLEPVFGPRYGQWDENWGRGITRLLLERHLDFDAIIGGNDQIARGCVDALKDAGKAIPQDVAVMGHDNWDILVTGTRPMLTSTDNNLEQIGALAARFLRDAIEGHPHHGTTLVPCKLIQRDSTLPNF